ncbi:hypothetical protein [Methylomonas albis]|nr:hypothetical protein [Methylomonas albis]
MHTSKCVLRQKPGQLLRLKTAICSNVLSAIDFDMITLVGNEFFGEGELS